MKQEISGAVEKTRPDQVTIDREDFEQMKRQIAELKKEQTPGWAFAAPELYWLTGGGKGGINLKVFLMPALALVIVYFMINPSSLFSIIKSI